MFEAETTEKMADVPLPLDVPSASHADTMKFADLIEPLEPTG